VKYEKLTRVQNRFEADLMMEALARHGVDCYLKTFEDTAYDGLFVAQEGWGNIWVADHDLPLARDILQSFHQAYDPEQTKGETA